MERVSNRPFPHDHIVVGCIRDKRRCGSPRKLLHGLTHLPRGRIRPNTRRAGLLGHEGVEVVRALRDDPSRREESLNVSPQVVQTRTEITTEFEVPVV